MSISNQSLKKSIRNVYYVKIYDISGALIMAETVTNNNGYLPLRGLNNGLFIIKLENANQQKIFKLIKD